MSLRPKGENSAFFAIYCMLAAFATYFCMYAFRKPFAVGMYEGLEIWGIDYKIVLIISQVLGYTLSKFIGIKVVSEATRKRRIFLILAFIGVAEIALVLFGLIPPPYNFICLFFNGLPLGMIWGLVFSFLEGRRFTELLGAGLCASFILASGVVKSVGKFLIEQFAVSEFWMPAATGLVFVPPLLLSVWLLSKIPPPTAEDEQLRTQRVPMDARQRLAFFRQFALGIVLLVAVYAALNAYRDFRDNFSVEIWTALGYGGAPAIFTLSELPIALITLIAAGSMILIKDNRQAFWISQASVFLGAALIALTTFGYEAGVVDPALWMISVGLGMYIPYIAYHVMIFERLIAMFRVKSNIGYLVYLADAFGYLASVLVMLYRDFGAGTTSWLDFFIWISYAMAAGCVILMGLSLFYFRQKEKEHGVVGLEMA